MNTGDLGINGRRLYDAIKAMAFDSMVCMEVGVRDGVGSALMLEATRDKPNAKVIGIEASEIPAALKANPRYEARECVDSVTALSEHVGPVHCCLVDSLHIAEQVMCETYFLWDWLPINGLIAYHDSNWGPKRDHYLGRDWDTLEMGVRYMFGGRPEVQLQWFPESWGMCFAWKRADFDLKGALDWKPVFAGRNALLAVLPENVRKREITP